MVAQIRDPHKGAQGKGAMRAGHCVHVVGLTGRGGQTLQRVPIPGSSAELEPVLTMNRLRLGRAVVALLSVHRSGSARARQEERRRHERRRNDRKS